MTVRLRVLTINIQGNQSLPERMRVLNQGLRELAPDVLAVQEVIDGMRMRHRPDVT